MARSETGASLTRQHRDLQVRVRAGALRDYTRLWPLWQGDDESFGQLVAATVPLVRAHHRVSAVVASTYYRAFREAEGAPGVYTPSPAPLLDEAKVTASLYVTGQVMTGKALAAGQDPDTAKQTALVRTAGAVTRHVLQGGRDSLVLSTGEDPSARAWRRITGGKSCSFCQMLAGRGAVYKGEDTAEFQAHDHCACMAEPSFD